MSVNVAESYVKQQELARQILIAMKSNNTENVNRYTPLLVLEIFKNHSLTDASSCALINDVAKIYLSATTKTAAIPTLNLSEDEEDDES